MVNFKDMIKEEEKEESKQQTTKPNQETKIKYVPKKTGSNVSKIVMFLVFASVIGIFGLWWFYGDTENVILITMLAGGIFYLPLGIILGKIMLDPKTRVRALRAITRKNLGLISFVSRGRQIKSLIRNLDEDFIWIGKKVWHITNEKIYWYDEANEEKEIDLDPSKSYTSSGIPMLFIAINNLTPLSFGETTTTNKPEQLGSSMKGWAANQLANNVLAGKSIQIGMFLILIGVAAAATFSFLTWRLIEDQLLPAILNLQGGGVSEQVVEQVVKQVTQSGG